MLANWLARIPTWTRDPQLIAAALVALALGVTYSCLAQGYPGAFLLDDRARITGVDIDGPDLGSIQRAILEANSGLLGRPVSLFSLYLTKALYGENPAAFRYENILLHLTAGLLLFWFLGRLLQTPVPGHQRLQRLAWVFAAGLAGIWLIHPLHVSTVLYTVQRMTQLSTVFTLCALIAFVCARQSLIHRSGFPYGGATLLALFMGLGVFSKEDAALIPVYVLLLEFVVFRMRVADTAARQRLLALLCIFVAAPILLGTAYFAMEIGSLLDDYVMREFTLSERMATELVVLWRYVGLLLLPRLSSMSLFHDSIHVYSPLDGTVIIAIIAWIGALAFILARARRWPLAALGMLLFLAAHAMESTIIPLELMFEHRNYFASIGVLLIAFEVLLSLWSWSRQRMRLVGVSALIVLVGSFALLQAVRASGWKNESELLLITAEEQPESVRTKSMLANHLLQSGHIRRAKALMRDVIDQNDATGRHAPGTHLHLLMMHCFDREFPDELYQRTLHLVGTEPMNAYVVSGLKALQKQVVKDKCPAIPVDSMIALNVAAARNPATRDRYRFLTKAMAGSILGGSGQLAAARPFLESALEHDFRVPTHLQVDTLTRLAEACLHLDSYRCARDAIDDAQALLASSTIGTALSERKEDVAKLEQRLEAATAAPSDNTGEGASPEVRESTDAATNSR